MDKNLKGEEKNKIEKLIEEIGKKLDTIIILNTVDNLTGDEKLNLLRHSVGIKPTARILGKDKSYFKKKLKGAKKQNAKEEQRD